MEDNKYIVGLDLGSISVNAVVIDAKEDIIYEEEYLRHNGQPLKKAKEIVQKILKKYPFSYLAITGANGEQLSQIWDISYVEEVISQAKGIYHLHPEIKSVIDIGGCDAKFIILSERGEVKDFGMNSSCASGTGSFLDQQAKRLELNIENEFAEVALKSINPARLAGRCAVFAKTDMIHLQQKATPIKDITMGLCESLARSFKGVVARGKDLPGPISFQGGVAANKAMLIAFKKVYKREDIIVPEHYYSLGALGAALLTKEKKEVKKFNIKNLKKDFLIKYQTKSLPPLSFQEKLTPENKQNNTSSVEVYSRQAGNKPPRYECSVGVHLQQNTENLEKLQKDYKFPENSKLIDAYIGIDIGSVSTNVAVIDSQKHLIAKSYLPTAGKPIKAVQEGLREVRKKVEGKVKIKGTGTTGSGRYMIGAFVGADVIKNEITAQATGALNIEPEVDTIFEIGGQDSKFISLNKGLIIDFTMNKVCAAGTGSFLEEQAEKLKINIKKEFEKIAFSSLQPANLGDRCTVFMESSLFEHLQRGVPIPDLVAGLAYSIAYNYLNKVVENRKIGNNIFFQGGTACNKSVVAAFEEILGRKITVPPNNEVLGAIGTAILAIEEKREKSKFKGFGLSEVKYKMTSFECQDCPNHCQVNQVWIEGEEKPLTYGDRCEKYSGKERKRKIRKVPDFFKEREKILFSDFRKRGKRENRKKMGIPRALYNFELFPLWESFFTELNYEVVLSDKTNDKIVHQGVESVSTDLCFPMKIAHGHILNLLEKKVDYLFLPGLIDFEEKQKGFKRSYNCPWSQALPYFANSSIDFRKYPDTKVIEPRLSLRENLEKALMKIGKELNENPFKVKEAIKLAKKTQSNFYNNLRKKGKEVLGKSKGEIAFVIVSRPYNCNDPGLNLDLTKKIRDLGITPIPMDFLDLDISSTSNDYPNVYWYQGQKILSSARKIEQTDNLYPIYLTNFACGPDSFISKYFDEEMERPYLELQIDEHSAEAGVITRLEAFLDSIRNREILKGEILKKKAPEVLIGKIPPRDERKIYIPYMDDHSYALEAAFQFLGRKAEVMKASDSETLQEGQKFTTGRECYPCILTTGDIIKVIKNDNFQPEKSAFFMGAAQGPCRFGQYCAFQKQILKRIGHSEIPVISLDSENSYGGYGVRFTKLAWEGIVAIDILRKIQKLIRVEEIEKGETNRVYLKYRDEVRRAIKEGGNVAKVMKEAAVAFKKIEREKKDSPAITVVGEIYVRHNPFANEFVIDELEKLGVKVELASMREWFMYTNEIFRGVSLKENKRWEFIKNRVRNLFQEYMEERLVSPFKDLIKGFEEPDIKEILSLGDKYLDRSLRGEAILTIGKTLHSIKRGRDGVVNVMPFTCMPGNITMGIVEQIKKDYPDFPILNLSFDGSRQANYLNKLRTFVYQVENYYRAKEN